MKSDCDLVPVLIAGSAFSFSISDNLIFAPAISLSNLQFYDRLLLIAEERFLFFLIVAFSSECIR